MGFLGIDTSNYTTSTALLKNNGEMLQQKRLLPVKEGELGLRQSDAVFHHTRQLPELMEALFLEDFQSLQGVGASVKPRDAEGSYMPCFSVGEGMARSLAAALHVPFVPVSHQRGHIAAALYACGKLELFQQPFLAFHVSGGTTEGLLVKPSKELVFDITLVACSLDLKAGQAIDRVGKMLGLSFPAGQALDALSLEGTPPPAIKAVIKEGNCSLSGIENQCAALIKKGAARPDVARYCIESVKAAVDAMTENMLRRYGSLPVVFAGGVMSNSLIRGTLSEKYGAFFAEPAFSTDNAAGVALLTKMIICGEPI